MSYDLGVFDVSLAPKNRAEFLDWYDAQTEWDDPRGCYDPAICTPALQAWFSEMIKEFPALNGPFARRSDTDEIPHEADYNISSGFIYAAFGWDDAELAYKTCYRLAASHGVGFFDVSGDQGVVCVPDGKGSLRLAHSGDSREES